jgi:hypothetical protein
MLDAARQQHLDEQDRVRSVRVAKQIMQSELRSEHREFAGMIEQCRRGMRRADQATALDCFSPAAIMALTSFAGLALPKRCPCPSVQPDRFK